MEVLQSVADITGGSTYQALDTAQLEKIYTRISELEPEEYETLSFRPRLSLHHYPFVIVIIGYLLFFGLMTFRTQPGSNERAYD